ncbi:hypothetical protein ABBQ32_010583 [Trebouxia sp. C0010 RCD-2024]
MAKIATTLAVTLWLSVVQAATVPQQEGLRRVNTNSGQVHANSYTVDAEADRVLELPGAGKPEFGLFSGYVTVNEEAERALFYAFAESQSSPRDDPLLLWLNGGPGCSSLAGGFMSELGPFYPTPSGKLQKNQHAWNQIANIIFLESPAFVGWSYSNTSTDIVVGDERTAEDAYQFLLGFLARFPQYAGRPFWLAGESYGGHYVPNLALQVLEGNKKAEQNGGEGINLQGFLIGNAWTDASFDNEGAVDFWWTHALISDDVRNSLLRSCNFSGVGPLQEDLSTAAGLESNGKTERCLNAISKTQHSMQRINIYDIYADVCLPKHAHSEATQLALQLGRHPAVTAPAIAKPGDYDPCVDDEVEIYFNREDVQKAMHANTTGMPGPWLGCNPLIAYSMDDLFTSMLPKYRDILKHEADLDILIFSGDVDGIVPVIGTRRWVASLQLPVVKEWRPWYSHTGQVGGYVEVYDGLTFSTVRNAGHMVPYTQAERAYYLFSNWIHGKVL